MIGTKSADSMFYHTYKDYHKPELKPIVASCEKS